MTRPAAAAPTVLRPGWVVGGVVAVAVALVLGLTIGAALGLLWEPTLGWPLFWTLEFLLRWTASFAQVMAGKYI